MIKKNYEERSMSKTEKNLFTECPECESKKIHLVVNDNGVREYYCPDCHYTFVPRYMMDENIQIVREQQLT